MISLYPSLEEGADEMNDCKVCILFLVAIVNGSAVPARSAKAGKPEERRR